MMNRELEFRKRLMTTFKGEAKEHIMAVSRMLTHLEKSADPGKMELTIEAAYREVHSLKGAARSVNMDPLVSICRSMEGVFNDCREQNVYPDDRQVKNLLHALDWMSDLVSGIHPGEQENNYDVEALMQITRLLEQNSSSSIKVADPVSVPDPVSIADRVEDSDRSSDPEPVVDIANTFRVKLSTVDEIKSLYDEVFVSNQKLDRHLAEVWKARKSLLAVKNLIERQSRQMKRNGKGVIKGLNGSREEDVLDELKKVIESSDIEYAERFRVLKIDQEQGQRLLRDLGDQINEMLKQPVLSMLEIFPPMVRRLSEELGKRVEIKMQGTAQRIDRRIIENIKDPMVHIVRNAIDHGIEIPEKRRKRGKPETGQIQINVSQVSGKLVEIEVVDDGAGFNREAIKNQALSKGMATEEMLGELSEPEVDALVFRSGFTTTKMITELSGRGLGMAIVKENIERIGGQVHIHSTPNEGTRFKMTIPHSFGSVKGIRIQAGDHIFIIPERYTESVVSLNKVKIRSVEGSRAIIHQSVDMNVFCLKDIMGIREEGELLKKELKTKYGQEQVKTKKLLILHWTDQWIALEVDDVIRDHEFILKPLPYPLEPLKMYEGVAMLSTGQPVLVVNIPYLLENIAHKTVRPVRSQFSQEPAKMRHRVLVVEDSVTARMLIKDILESASLEVTTANDGEVAWELLNEEPFDLVVSDIEMPNMDGIALTENIKADKSLSDLPVILVTTLKSREDRMRGLEAGADAYIEKGGFEPEYLLSVVEKLIIE